MTLRRYGLVLTLALVVALAVLAWFLPSNEDFRTENPSWNGSGDFSALVSALPLISLADLPPAPAGTGLILVPYREFSQSELTALEGYVSDGGILFLADDYGFGNQVLNHLGLELRFAGVALLDPLASYKNQQMPRLTRLAESPLTDGLEILVLNNATSLTGVADEDVLAWSSSFSFLDINDNDAWDEGEATGPLPVISEHRLGTGRVIAVADPSLFINGMAPLEDNLGFIQNVAAMAPAGLYIDQSHLPPSSLHQTKDLLADLRDFIVTPGGTVALVIVFLIVTPLLAWPPKKNRKDTERRSL